MIRIGIGYDIHRFDKGRKLILGGVEIPFEKGLIGHSDADVLLHAICDALLGALGAGDIGMHFPDRDPAYKDISSLKLLQQVYKLVKEKGYRINNVDSTIIAERPRLKDYIKEMANNIGNILEIGEGDINIKATTNEGLGPLGRCEGVAAYAVCTIVER